MIYSKDKTINGVVCQLLKGDWFVKSNKRHVRLKHKVTSDVITVPFSPTCSRAAQNWLHQIKRTCGVLLC